MPHIINGVSCRSKIESLQHIIDQAKKSKIGPNVRKGDPTMSCFYQYPSGNNCAIGSLFSEAQLKEINCSDDPWHGHNEESIAGLALRFGKKNVETVTGMSVPELTRLQHTHDEALQGFADNDEGRVKNARQAVIELATEMLKMAQAKV
jgi:hypothetical protein